MQVLVKCLQLGKGKTGKSFPAGEGASCVLGLQVYVTTHASKFCMTENISGCIFQGTDMIALVFFGEGCCES